MKNPNLCRIISHLITILGLIIAMISSAVLGIEPLPILFYIGTTISFAGIIFGIITVRCPFCGKGLRLIGLRTDYCEHCGQKLD